MFLGAGMDGFGYILEAFYMCSLFFSCQQSYVIILVCNTMVDIRLLSYSGSGWLLRHIERC